MIGKCFGVLFGFLVTKSFAGILLGLLVGHLFDVGLRQQLQPWGISPDAKGRIQALFFKTTFSVMGHIAKVDGRVNESEIKLAEMLMRELGLQPQQRQQAIEYFRIGKESDFDIKTALGPLKEHCATYPHLLNLFLDIQLQGVYADGDCHPNERAILHIICQELGISTFFLAQAEARLKAERAFRARYHQNTNQQRTKSTTSQASGLNELQAAYAVLGVKYPADLPTVKKAYRRLMSTHHPDKLIAQGLPEEMIAVATERAQKIQQAYDYIAASQTKRA